MCMHFASEIRMCSRSYTGKINQIEQRFDKIPLSKMSAVRYGIHKYSDWEENKGDTIACDHDECSIVWFHYSLSLDH